jgi:hypothetical protein
VLTELLVSVAIVVGLLGVVFELVDPSDGTAAVQSLAADVQQRQRAALAELHRQLLLAGSGPHPGMNGIVAHLRPAVAPALRGMAGDRTRGTDRLSVLYAPPGETGALLAGEVATSPATVGLAPAGSCALPCGLSDRGGGLALVFDAAGRSDLYRITDLTGAAAVLEHVGGGAPVYSAGSFIAPMLVRGFYLDREAEQLRVHNGAGSDLPFVDGVVEFTVRYFGVPQPALPPAPRPAVMAPCLAAVAAAVPVGSGIEPLNLDIFADGPSCGGDTSFDVDLFRIRRVRVELTLRVADPAWRRPATGSPLMPIRNAAIRDVAASLDVVPRSLADW